MIKTLTISMALIILCLCYAMQIAAEPRAMEVTVTAYNSTKAQTDADPHIGACNKRITSNSNAIAVSRDLFRMGLDCGTEVALEGFEKNFVVMDKMNKRFSKRIDIHMGKKIKQARNWGVKKLMIWWYRE